MTDCIFCKIINKKIPATILYEDNDLLAFMDIGPIIKGHVLIIPKQHYAEITDTPDHIVAKLYLTAKLIVKAQKEGLNADGSNIIQNNGTAAGQEVAHIHLHVIPRFNEDGHRWNWTPKSYSSSDEIMSLAQKIKSHLS